MQLKVEIAKAHELALEVHGDQTDKAGEPYIFHVLRVANEARNRSVYTGTTKAQLYIVGLLHDVVEDSKTHIVHITVDSLLSDFGPGITEAVDAITHRPNESYKEYIYRVKKNKLATGVKLADLCDNADFDRFIKLAAIDQEAFDRVVDVLIPRYIRAYEFLTRE